MGEYSQVKQQKEKGLKCPECCSPRMHGKKNKEPISAGVFWWQMPVLCGQIWLWFHSGLWSRKQEKRQKFKEENAVKVRRRRLSKEKEQMLCVTAPGLFWSVSLTSKIHIGLCMCVFAPCPSTNVSVTPWAPELLSPRQQPPIPLCTAQGLTSSLCHKALRSIVWSVCVLINCSGDVMKENGVLRVVWTHIYKRERNCQAETLKRTNILSLLVYSVVHSWLFCKL